MTPVITAGKRFRVSHAGGLYRIDEIGAANAAGIVVETCAFTWTKMELTPPVPLETVGSERLQTESSA